MRLPWAGAHLGGPVVLVLAGHAGAGASTVALAIAEGLAYRRPVQLVEYAKPALSGLAAASSIELGADGPWRRGRRGGLEVLRLAGGPAETGPPRLPEAAGVERLLVVDAGWSLTTELLGAESVRAFGHGERVVVVTRGTVPAVRQTEHVLSTIGGEALVAAVGPARWPRAVEASSGPLLSKLRSCGRVVPVPVDRRLETAGLTADGLPRRVAAAGRSLAALVTPVVPSPDQQHRVPSTRTSPARGLR
ncbi:hypothetical protein [Geodermatophilus sabuli]|uniref:hypothetical protein n=1 Tax=Geodermatophilus sabuli TaxID=1564158 RepID=UPI001827B8E6|nr:hypothetical protein [Geodermatophilus sabuli]MBB3084690.1 hypothetical protein [Geodermatophilus sabuli]